MSAAMKADARVNSLADSIGRQPKSQYQAAPNMHNSLSGADRDAYKINYVDVF